MNIKLVAAILLSGLLHAQAATPPVTVAIFDFESKEEKDLGGKIATLLNAHLSANPDLILVERAELDKVLGEQELGLSGTVSGETAAKVGHLTGAKVLVTGKVFKADKDLIVVGKIIGTETSRVFAEMAKATFTNPIDELARQLAQQIATNITARADSLVAKVPTHDDRVKTINEALGTAKRPAIWVNIPEQHFGAPVADPAAQTEFALILQQAGFTLVDGNSSQKADIHITGEAFSALGLRRGNLVTCKARVELKAQTRTDGKILAVDRETAVAVDITEHTSAKTALAQAAANLASRVALKLAPARKLAANP